MLKKIEDMNYYELLEVSPRATSQEIHRAYERIRRIYDPNSIALYSLFSPEETDSIRQRIEEAYRTLIYEENRRAYDLKLQGPAGQLSVDQALLRTAVPTPFPAAERSEVRPAAEPPAPAAPQAPETPAVLPLQPVPTDIREFTGSVLKMMREQRGLSIRNISETTKLSARYIEGIEEENYQKLPVRPYLRGFLVLYCKAIGYEPERIVTDYMKRYDLAKNPPKK